MKKRSLFAAVAMLLVSAIVLTSATYAWFASNDSASVAGIKASVTNTDGNLRVKASGDYALSTATWGNAVLATDYDSTLLPTVLKPVSFRMKTNPTFTNQIEETPIKVTYDGVTFGPATAVTTAGTTCDFLKYSFDVDFKTNDDTGSGKTVTLTPGTPDRGGSNFIYFYVETNVGGTKNGYWYGSDKYEPVIQAISSGSTLPDDSRDAVLGKGTQVNSVEYSGADTGAASYVGTMIEAGTPSAITLGTGIKATKDATTGAVTQGTLQATVTVYIWAEGNDLDCTGSASAKDANISFSLAAA